MITSLASKDSKNFNDYTAAEAYIRTHAPDKGWIIAQSFTQIRFAEWPDFPLAFKTTFSGRIFAESAEVRWLCEAGQIRVWELHETLGSDFRREKRRYYLWGVWEHGRFAEAVVRRLAEYPPLQACQEKTRPYIDVYEYLPNTPGRDLQASDLMRELNRPRLAAHRFVEFGCGKD